MIPDFSQLSLEPTVSTQPTSLELPQDLWERILGALDTYNPYDEIVKLCAITSAAMSRRLANAASNGTSGLRSRSVYS